ncbi:MAG: hypothetical protein N4P96_00345 [Candidatus Lightella neohaematopini]|nr:hypothetical protein [Candidatus Lightella neohaematopini]
MCNTKYDIAIIGGGIIGMSLALLLKLNKFNIKLISINFNYKFNKWKILLNNNDIIYSDIVIRADESSSLINKILNDNINIWYYKQSCLLIRVITNNISDTI